MSVHDLCAGGDTLLPIEGSYAILEEYPIGRFEQGQSVRTLRL